MRVSNLWENLLKTYKSYKKQFSNKKNPDSGTDPTCLIKGRGGVTSLAITLNEMAEPEHIVGSAQAEPAHSTTSPPARLAKETFSVLQQA